MTTEYAVMVQREWGRRVPIYLRSCLQGAWFVVLNSDEVVGCDFREKFCVADVTVRVQHFG